MRKWRCRLGTIWSISSRLQLYISSWVFREASCLPLLTTLRNGLQPRFCRYRRFPDRLGQRRDLYR